MNRHWPGVLACTVLFAILFTWSLQAQAIVFNLPDRSVPRLRLFVGQSGPTINEVVFTVPIAELGNGTPITSSPSIRFRMVIRATAANPLVGTLSVNSSTSLSNGSSTLSFRDISWTSRDGDIPDGSFDGMPDQTLVSYPSSVRVDDMLTFSYANTSILEAGTYTGRVVYTLAFP